MNMYRHLYVSNEFGDRLPLAEFLTMPPADQYRMAEGRFNYFKILERKLKQLSKEEREEYERSFRAWKQQQTEIMAQQIRG